MAIGQTYTIALERSVYICTAMLRISLADANDELRAVSERANRSHSASGIQTVRLPNSNDLLVTILLTEKKTDRPYPIHSDLELFAVVAQRQLAQYGIVMTPYLKTKHDTYEGNLFLLQRNVLAELTASELVQ